MNREIKYQAWDRVNQVMFNVARFDFADYTVYSHLFGKGTLAEDCDIREYTGLKDKKGVEIYEGDIVGIEFGDVYHYAIVKYSGWYWYADVVFVKDIIQFEEFCDERDMSADCKVLGNIYENPELLERSND